MKSETYYCTDNGSDKVYTVTLDDSKDVITVTGFGGRRGETLKAYPKYSGGDLAQAEKIYARACKDRLAHGYYLGEAAPSIDGATTAKAAVLRESMYKPMLLNSISTDEAAAYLTNPEWLMQQKHDGVRAIVDVDVSQKLVQTASRRLLPVALTNEQVKELLTHGPGSKYTLDCEVIGEHLVVLDILSVNGTDLSAYPCADRCRAMEALDLQEPIIITLTHKGIQKARRFKLLSDNGAEGVVFKRCNAPYQQGRPNKGGDGLKCKFKATASLKVIGVKTDGKDSIDVATSDGRKVASCSTIGKTVPPLGSIVEVEYLYGFRNGGIIQAIYLSVREDKSVADSPESIQYKGEKR